MQVENAAIASHAGIGVPPEARFRRPVGRAQPKHLGFGVALAAECVLRRRELSESPRHLGGSFRPAQEVGQIAESRCPRRPVTIPRTYRSSLGILNSGGSPSPVAREVRFAKPPQSAPPN
jgi:hypothetical protein